MPGTRLLAVARLWFAPSIVSSVFEPLVADWQREWHEAPLQRRVWTNVSGRAAFVMAGVVLAPRIAVTPVPWPLAVRLATRVAGFYAIALAITTAVMLGQGTPLSGWLALAPALLTILVPFAMAPAADAIRCQTAWPTDVERHTAVKLIAIGSIAMVLNGQASLATLPVLFFWMRWRLLAQGSQGWGTPIPASVIAAGTVAAVIVLRSSDPALQQILRTPSLALTIALAVLAITMLTGPRRQRRTA